MDGEAKPPLGYLSDAATEVDLFNAGAIARTIARLIREASDDAMTIGVHGAWGAGKSSLLAMVAAILAKRSDIVCLAFSGASQAIEPEVGAAQFALIECAALGLIERRFADAAEDGDVARVLHALARLKGDKTAFLGHIDAAPPAIEEFGAAFAQLMRKAAIERLVVLVDDLDHCPPAAAAEILATIRTILLLDKLVFIVGADVGLIEDALRAHLPALPQRESARRGALSPSPKLIDAPFDIPALGAAETKVYVALLLLGAALGETSAAFAKARALGRAALARPWDAIGFERDALRTALGASFEDQRETLEFADAISPVLAPGAKGNPRQIKRFLNALALRRALAAERGFGAAIELRPLAKLMLAERCLPPGVFDHIAASIANSRRGVCLELALIETEARIGPARRAALHDGDIRHSSNPILADWRLRPEVLRWAAIEPRLGALPLKPYLFCFGDRRSDFAPSDFAANEPPPAADAESAGEAAAGHGGLLTLACLALIVGAASGLIGALFRLSLEQADGLRNAAIVWAHGAQLAGFLSLMAICALAVALSAWLVRRFSPFASGSGIPHVEAVLTEALPRAPFSLIPVKFFGGLLAIGAGLALGREGPSVQMGASIAHLVGKVFRRNWPDCRVLFAAGAGAGLATAFNAPIGGAIFVLEELVRRFEPRIAIAALGASAIAISVSRALLGNSPDFEVGTLAYASVETRPLFFALGGVAGLAAILYNRTLLGAMAAAARFDASAAQLRVGFIGVGVAVLAWLDLPLGAVAGLAAVAYNWTLSHKSAANGPRRPIPVELRAGLIGATVGMLAWFAPDLVGGGDAITQRALAGGQMLALLPLLFLFRLGLGAVSYAAGTPGGLFAPLLVLGAQLGLAFGQLCQLAFPDLDIQPTGFAIVGMAAFFTGVVRAPLTGIVLVSEMTESVTLLLPMLGACFIAMLVPTVLRNPPIYDSLRELTMAAAKEAYARSAKFLPGWRTKQARVVARPIDAGKF
jgi:CIC family chloride channel protein